MSEEQPEYVSEFRRMVGADDVRGARDLAVEHGDLFDYLKPEETASFYILATNQGLENFPDSMWEWIETDEKTGNYLAAALALRHYGRLHEDS